MTLFAPVPITTLIPVSLAGRAGAERLVVWGRCPRLHVRWVWGLLGGCRGAGQGARSRAGEGCSRRADSSLQSPPGWVARHSRAGTISLCFGAFGVFLGGLVLFCLFVSTVHKNFCDLT